jgi:ribosome-associated toxin RatA of RatAB toxin-antitoxin module
VVDIANIEFEDLPSNWKYENLEAAKVAVDLVYDKVVNSEEINSKMIEEMSKIVHEKWLERN